MNKNSLIIGISGGIDSSVTSTICALTGMKIIVLSVPSFLNKGTYSSLLPIIQLTQRIK